MRGHQRPLGPYRRRASGPAVRCLLLQVGREHGTFARGDAEHGEPFAAYLMREVIICQSRSSEAIKGNQRQSEAIRRRTTSLTAQKTAPCGAEEVIREVMGGHQGGHLRSSRRSSQVIKLMIH